MGAYRLAGEGPIETKTTRESVKQRAEKMSIEVADAEGSNTYPDPVQRSITIVTPLKNMVFYSLPGVFKYMTMSAHLTFKTIVCS